MGDPNSQCLMLISLWKSADSSMKNDDFCPAKMGWLTLTALPIWWDLSIKNMGEIGQKKLD